MNDRLILEKRFYSNNNDYSLAINVNDEIAALIASCSSSDSTFLNCISDTKLRVLYAEINNVIKCNYGDMANFGKLLDERILRGVYNSSVFMTEGMGAKYLIEAVIICKKLFVNQDVIVAGEIYREVADKFNVSPEAVEKATRYFIKSQWAMCRDKVNGVDKLTVYNFIFPSFTSPPTNKETIVYMAVKMLEIQKIIESITT